MYDLFVLKIIRMAVVKKGTLFRPSTAFRLSRLQVIPLNKDRHKKDG